MINMNAAVREELAKSWWIWLVRGILGIALSILAFTKPGATLAAIAIFIGAYFLVDGVVTLFHGFGSQPEGQSRWPRIIWGIISILAGIVILSQPLVSVISLTILVGAFAIVYGIMAIITGIRLRKEISDEWWLIIGGIAGIIFGFLIFSNVLAGALSIAMLIGIWALITGITFIILAFKVKGLAK